MFRVVTGCVGCFVRSRRGGVALAFALLAPVFLGCLGISVDYATWLLRKQKLQNLVDVTALAVVSDMQVGGFDKGRAWAVAKGQTDSLAETKIRDEWINLAIEPVYRRNQAQDPFAVALVNERDQAPTGVRLTLSQRKHAIMTKLVAPYLTDIVVRATAEIVGTSKVCIVALEDRAGQAIGLNNNAQVSATGCSVYAMSASPAAIDARDASKLSAMKACAVGGYAGTSQHYQPVPITGCPAIKDPLAGRVAPPMGHCINDHRNRPFVVESGSTTLTQGVYCGGLILKPGANVRLEPGVYIIKDGPLVVGSDFVKDASGRLRRVSCLCYRSFVSQRIKSRLRCPTSPTNLPAASLSGDRVAFYFTGSVEKDEDDIARPIQFMPRSNVSLSAPLDEPTARTMAGLLFFEDRAAPANRVFEIMSDNARRLVGTIYLPRGTFLVSANQVVADQSEYTAIVARRLALSEAPRLVVNANYGASKVPVPKGIGPTSAYPTLTN
ncbi:Putative Flp pilus-assembly TadE/G-like [Methylobacterium sp. 174MFSha1.1]|uniref:TadE/TadG family type IV pilus assembly protein n=1 Tax=Methylobacterium sp. 174MFSha1.1 TaxID=1502749 RepID=UPI0008F4092A|nr:TadE/TadG family type IV pilus assembly protein [Methylobacterium sp. 174MFSha1.1]SFU84339.1 Putative Flp pilus-assembly TadE/G-like [Methylobacterium sp. 174MFSha1.1]